MIAILITTLLATATSIGTEPTPEPIYGGNMAPTCSWPSAVAVNGPTGACTGSLVHPEIVVTAAHCLENGPMTSIGLGEDSWSPAYEVPIAGCKQHPNYQLDYPDYADFMYCRLAEPLVGVPTVPILMGCETDALVPGASSVLAGYGVADTGGPEGAKRFVTTTIDSLQDSRVFFAGGTGRGTCNGDSGGPSYLQLADGSWRVFGTTTGGMICGDIGQSELIHLFVPWVEMESGLDITPCHDADGTWAPTEACGAFPAEPDAPATGSWASLCGGGPFTPPSETCGPAFGEDPTGDDSGGSDDGLGESDDDGGSDDGGDTDDTDDPGDTGGDTEDDGDDGDYPWPQPPVTTTSSENEPAAGCSCSSDASARDRGVTTLLAGLVVLALRRRRNAKVGVRSPTRWPTPGTICPTTPTTSSTTSTS